MNTKKGWNYFLKLCQSKTHSKELDKLLSFILTAQEQEHIATRVLITRELLRKEKTQREIATELKISIAKITRGSNALKDLPPQSQKILMKLLET